MTEELKSLKEVEPGSTPASAVDYWAMIRREVFGNDGAVADQVCNSRKESQVAATMASIPAFIRSGMGSEVYDT